MLPPELRHPDGSQHDPLAYFIRCTDNGLFQLVSPLGDGLDLTDTYASAKAFWLDAQYGRKANRWYQNLTGWLVNSVCTPEELGALLLLRRISQREILNWRPKDSWREAVQFLGATAEPWPEHLTMLKDIRKQCATDGVSAIELLAGLKMLEASGADLF